MGKDGDSRGLVSKEYLDCFAELFERSEYAKDPNSREARESESDFNSLLDQVYSTEVEPRCPSISPSAFKAFIRRHCQAIIANRDQKITCPPPSA
jgi:hypothetical protein